MKKTIYGIMAMYLLVGLAGCTQAIRAKPGSVEVATSKVMMSKKAEVVIKGTGFKPGQEVNLLITTADGVKTDISHALKPKPVADKTGAWVTTWSCGRYISKKLIKEGEYIITVTDNNYNFIARAPVTFYAEKKSK